MTMSRKRVLTANWKRQIRSRWGIKLWRQEKVPAQRVLWVTRCSKIKNARKHGTPKNLYGSPVNQRFYQWAEYRNLRYGILSDKYGLHLDNESLEWYDIHPSQLSEDNKTRLGKEIAKKSKLLKKRIIVFYNPSPLRSVPYFEMLAESGLEIYYTTRLPNA